MQASGQGCDSRRLRGGGCTPDMGMNRAGCGCTFHPPSLPFPRAPTREADRTPGASASASAAAAVARPCGRAPSSMQPLARPSARASRPNSTAGPRRAGRRWRLDRWERPRQLVLSQRYKAERRRAQRTAAALVLLPLTPHQHRGQQANRHSPRRQPHGRWRRQARLRRGRRRRRRRVLRKGKKIESG